ncbi:penicillin acylase family protein [Jidongwangia harbinensis]|uniref:penicillin acylase family protein n=1 Tax=Jidongwangia harbinensis TaxID=2878561 RepID=UPI001CD9A15A|nr:penicillin acylase family protein [Jidongwangia harbinensis]MCA2219342.1 penicillin acylase family protein [Jidongwangia harbinensis]
MAISARRVIRRSVDGAGSLVALTAVLVLTGAGAGPLPALGSVLNPGTGVWHLSADAVRTTSGDHSVPGLHRPATVRFEPTGIAHVDTADDNDLWRVTGYLHARFRLSQMDLARRQGSGTLAAVLGPAGLESDRFELDLGLRRAAERDWAMLPAGATRDALTAYADGVNAVIGTDQSPAVVKLLGYAPQPWTPVDTLVVQRLETQTLSFATSGPVFSRLSDALGRPTFDQWFPARPARPKFPYDTGDHQRRPLVPLPIRADPAAASPAGGSPPGDAAGRKTALGAEPATRIADVPMAVHRFGASNAFAVAGSRTASGKPLLEADPHLDLTLPSVWYQIEGTSPGFHFAGATIPGVPVPLMGRTDQISWGITDAQHPTTLFYREKRDPNRPGRFFHRGAWRAEDTLDYRIEVKGQDDHTHTVRLTAHGPIVHVQNEDLAVWWAGALPGDEIGSMLKALRARDVTGFRAALAGWTAPALNFVYADRSGTIAAFDVGVAPQVPGSEPALVLPGDGSADVTGSIPDDQLPRVVNPPGGVVVSANQREVDNRYPYQYSTSYNFPDPGWRAAEIHQQLAAVPKLTAEDVRRIQNDQHDHLLETLTPLLRRALAGTSLSTTERSVRDQLTGWDGDMAVGKVAPLVMRNLALRLVYDVFQPHWARAGVAPDDENLALHPFTAAQPTELLLDTLMGWLVHDPGNRHLTPPGQPRRDATALLRQTYRATVAHLTATHGTDLAAWAYGQHQAVQFPSLLQAAPLDAGPYQRGGDNRTINVAAGALYRDGKPDASVSTGGASWRFIMDWGTGAASAVYPGGQSESPLSPWYANGITPWRAGELWPIRYGPQVTAATAPITWRMKP